MRNAEARSARRWTAASWLLVALSPFAAGAQRAMAVKPPNVIGSWATLAYTMPINPVHIALLHNGKVLIVSGSGNDPTVTTFQAAIWDPQAGTIVARPVTWDMFCNGMVILADGRAFINGGTVQYDPFFGSRQSSIYDPATDTFTDVQNMAHGRWYPTVTNLADGTVMSFSGLDGTSATNSAVEIYAPGSGWSQEYPAGWTPPLYPRMHLLPNGNVFYSGSTTESRIFDTHTRTWSDVIAETQYGDGRPYGSSVLLPLTLASGYAPRIMLLGGDDPATSSTELIDLSADAPAWEYGPDMSQSRVEMNATILPNGKVLATGGSRNDEDGTTKSLKADLYDPITNTFSAAGSNAYARLYHSNSLLLPDATVMLVGGNPTRGSYQKHIERYTPAYLYNKSGALAARPTISSVSPAAFSYRNAFQVVTPNAASIKSVVLVRPGAPTHAFDMEQRLVELPFTAGAGVLNVTAPPSGGVAPPGYYMVFILNTSGVPSVAAFIHLQ